MLKVGIGEGVPVGVPLPWPGANPPPGYLVCNGQTFNKTTYPLLASAYPSGRVPDLRGQFIRGWDNGRGVDPGRAIISEQGDAIRRITGSIRAVRQGGTFSGAVTSGVFVEGPRFNVQVRMGDSDNWGSTYNFDSARQVPSANENRPKNTAFNYIVRAA